MGSSYSEALQDCQWRMLSSHVPGKPLEDSSEHGNFQEASFKK